MNEHGLKFATFKTINPVCRSSFFPVSIDNYTVRLIDNYLDCTAFFYLGQGDRHYREIPTALRYNVSTPLLSDHFVVKCTKSKNVLSPDSRSSYPKVPYISIRYDHKVRQRLAAATKQKDDYNVLILGLDSVSRLQFERMLPKTYAYVTEKLGGIVLNGEFI